MSTTPTPAADVNIVAIETEALTFSQRCQAVNIADQGSYDQAVDFRVTAREWLKNVKDDKTKLFGRMRDAAYQAYQAVLGQQKAVCDPVERGLNHVDSEIARWDREQRRIEEERRRAAETEQNRIEEMRRQSTAIDAIDNGADDESVEAILHEPAALPPVRVEPTYERSRAVATIDNYKATIVDLKKFVKHVAKECDKNPGLLELLVGLKPAAVAKQYESPGLNKTAKAQKQSLTIPGVKVYNDSFVKNSSRR